MMAATETQSRVELTMGEALNRALDEALASDEPVMLLGQDIGPYGGTFGVTRGLHDRYGDEVVRDGPLCESATVGFGIGLAISGVRCIVEIEFFDFVGVAMDQIFNQAAKLHYFTGGKLSVPLVIRTPIVARMGMGPQHSQSLEAWFMHIPGIKVALPSNATDAYGLMRSALRDQNPILFIENVRLYGRRAEVELDSEPVPFGKARVRREGTDVTVVALSGMVDEALAAAETLGDRGVSVEVIDPRTIVPLDMDTILASLRKTMRLAVAHDAHKTGGFGAELAARCMEEAFDYLDAPVERVAALDVPIPCTPSGIEAVYPHAASVVAACERLCGLQHAA
jgi:acetoin:2,6-dichlorophenolindophenol oxidoreductase subunit beta